MFPDRSKGVRIFALVMSIVLMVFMFWCYLILYPEFYPLVAALFFGFMAIVNIVKLSQGK